MSVVKETRERRRVGTVIVWGDGPLGNLETGDKDPVG